MITFPWNRDDSGDSREDFDDATGEHSGTGTDGDPRTENGLDGAGSGSDGGRQDGAEAVEPVPEEEAIVSCKFQDGTLRVFEDVICIERPGRSKFSDKWIALNQVQDVIYERRLVINYLQIDQVDFQLSDASLLSTPVDENTVHFGRGKRDCAQRATDEILERLGNV